MDAEQVLAVIPAIDHVVTGSFILDSGTSWHRQFAETTFGAAIQLCQARPLTPSLRLATQFQAVTESAAGAFGFENS